MAVKDLVSGVLAESITTSTTNILVHIADNISAQGITDFFPNPPFYITIMPKAPASGVSNRLDSEIIKITNVGHDQVGNAALTCVRGQRDTTAKAFSAGDIVTAAIYTEDIAGTVPEVKNEYTESTDDVYSSSYVNSAVNAFHSGNYANFNFGAFTVTNQERVLGTHTCTVAGTYLIIMSLSFDLSNGGFVIRRCYKNNVVVAADTPNIINQANAPRMGGTFATVQTLAVGDVVKMTYQGYISGSADASNTPNNGWAMIRII